MTDAEVSDLVQRLRNLTSIGSAVTHAAADEIERLTAEIAIDEQRVADLMTGLDRMAKERDALRADAARYRWLRNADNDCSCVFQIVDSPKFGMARVLDGEQFDAAIDAQIAKEASNG